MQLHAISLRSNQGLPFKRKQLKQLNNPFSKLIELFHKCILIVNLQSQTILSWASKTADSLEFI